MEIISKAEARAAGLDRYFTGKTCIHGHISERYLSGNCIECRQEKERIRRENEREKRRAASLAYYYANRETLKAKKREYYLSKKGKGPKK